MIRPQGLIIAVVAITVIAIASALFVREMCAVLRHRARAGSRVSPLLKKWLAFSYACVCDRTLVIETPTARNTLRLDDVAEIRYSYHAAVGFIAWLEFFDSSGVCISVDESIAGVRDNVLPWLELHLPDFRISALSRCIVEGDLEDTCRIWTSA